MNYPLLHDFVNLLQAYHEAHGQEAASLPALMQWAQQQGEVQSTAAAAEPDTAKVVPISAAAPYESHTGFGQYGGMPDVTSAVGRLVIVLSRYARKYGKLAVADTPFSTLDDITFLAGTIRLPGVSKMKLIEMNTQEKPAGMEIIRRLLKQGFITQGSHPEDGRSQALYPTPAGMQAFGQYVPRLSAIGKMVVGNLTLDQQETLHTLLHQLDDFHLPIYENRKLESFQDLQKAFGVQA